MLQNYLCDPTNFCNDANEFDSYPSWKKIMNYRYIHFDLGTYFCIVKLHPDFLQVLLIAITLERLGDNRCDAAYSRAVSLAPQDALFSINFAGRHARAGRFTEALYEANRTAQLLEAEEKPDAQVSFH